MKSTIPTGVRPLREKPVLGALLGGVFTAILVAYANRVDARNQRRDRFTELLPSLVAGGMGYLAGVGVKQVSQHWIQPVFVHRVTSEQFGLELLMLAGILLVILVMTNVLLAVGIQLNHVHGEDTDHDRLNRGAGSRSNLILFGIAISLILVWIPLQDVAVSASQRMKLFQAAGRGELQELRRLIRQGVSLNDPVGDVTSLMVASGRGREQAVRILLDHGTDLGATDDQGLTALHWSALMGSPGTTRRLLEAGADPLKKNYEGHTPFYLAARRCHIEIVNMLEASLRRNDTQNERTQGAGSSFRKEYRRVQKALELCRTP